MHQACSCTHRTADIVPSLDENRILERWNGGVRLLQARLARGSRLPRPWTYLSCVPHQVAAQELAWGLKFSATATLDIEELPNGINAAQRDGYALHCMLTGGAWQ